MERNLAMTAMTLAYMSQKSLGVIVECINQF